jgi:hypothetical protein
MSGDPRVFKVLTALWVTVTNHAGDATFTAQIAQIQPVERAEDGLHAGPLEVHEVAWESDTAPEKLIRWRKKSRLKLAMGALNFNLFWFWTAESATHTSQGPGMGWKGYGIGWRLRPLAPRVEFDLEVIDATHVKSVTKTCFIDFDSNNQITDFGFLD